MAERVRVAVVGLGAMGSALLYQLARRGIQAVGIDRFRPPHDRGSSHGDSRITREGMGEGPEYFPFAKASHRIWRELEAETGETLFTACGLLIVAPPRLTASHHGKPNFLGQSLEVAREAGIPHEVLDAAELARRFPHMAGAPGEVAYFEPGGGYLRPERCIAVQLARAEALGAEIRVGTSVTGLAETPDGIRIETEAGPIEADQAVVAAGAWAGPLLGPPFDRLCIVARQVFHWFALAEHGAIPEDAPTFLRMHGHEGADYFYGFPPLPGERSIKVGTEQYDVSTSADACDREVDPQDGPTLYRDHLAGRLGGITDRIVRTETCLYTVTPDFGFIIDRHPAMERVTVVSACSGHGFKHSAGIGEAVAELLATGRSPVDLAPFRLSRFGDAGEGSQAA